MTNREETNSAIGSWSGFIYQGLCGLLVALRMIRERQEAVAGYSLQLDAYEDFSILDEQGRIYSLHQCKSDKKKTNYDNEFEKMKAKMEKLKIDGLLKDEVSPNCFFHCNRKIDIDAKYGIVAYPFEGDVTFCEPGKIQSLLDDEIDQIKKVGSKTSAVRAALESLVNGEVLDIQQTYFDSKEKLSGIARKRKIEFSRFEEKLQSTIKEFLPGDFLLQMKQAYIMGMEERAEADDNDDNKEKAKLFAQRMSALPEVEMRRFIQRVNPKDKMDDTLVSWKELTAEGRLNYLYRLITEFPLDAENLDWRTKHSTQTPSTLGNDESGEKISKRIYENQANLDVLWLYDWIVGHQDEHIENIEESALDIMNITDAELDIKSIFHAKKVGIMTKQEKREGKYD